MTKKRESKSRLLLMPTFAIVSVPLVGVFSHDKKQNLSHFNKLDREQEQF